MRWCTGDIDKLKCFIGGCGMCVLQDAYPHLIQNARGQGTFCAIDAKSADIRNKVVSLSRDSGKGSTHQV